MTEDEYAELAADYETNPPPPDEVIGEYLYTERRCLICGQWRRQHHGESTNHHEMLCPLDERGQRISKWFGHTARFFPGPT